MDNRSAQHGFIWHLFHRAGQHQPTEWERVRAQITPNAPTQKPQILINPTRLKAMARNMRTPQIKLPSLHTYLRQHGMALPEPAHRPAPVTTDRAQMSEPIVGIEKLKTFTSPERTSQNEVAALPTLHSGSNWYEPQVRHTDAIQPVRPHADDTMLTLPPERFLLNDTSRDELFADVPPVGESLDDDDNAPTVLHERTRFKNTMSQLLGAEKGE